MNKLIKIAQLGKDVKTAGDDELVLSSDFNMLKIVASGEVTLVGGATDGVGYSKTVAHNLGFRPMALAQVKFPASLGGETRSVNANQYQWFSPDIKIRVATQMAVDDTNIIFVMVHDNIIGAENFIFKYYLFRETGVS